MTIIASVGCLLAIANTYFLEYDIFEAKNLNQISLNITKSLNNSSEYLYKIKCCPITTIELPNINTTQANNNDCCIKELKCKDVKDFVETQCMQKLANDIRIVEILLLIASFVAFVIAIVSSIITCRTCRYQEARQSAYT